MVDLEAYRAKPEEQQRVASLLSMIPMHVRSVLDVGARDGYLACRMADRGISVVALDLKEPNIRYHGVTCIKGDVLSLQYSKKEFDLVVCTEVLEHIHPVLLAQACAELQRVAEDYLLIGVPYRQDTRVGRLTCNHCDKVSPPWGHLNSFDEQKILALFSDFKSHLIEFVGTSNMPTNSVSSFLMDCAGNPWASYNQDEPCVHCGRKFTPRLKHSFASKILSRIAFAVQKIQGHFTRRHGNWIHILLARAK